MGDSLGKTETIKRRAMYAYLPSEGALRPWEKGAAAADLSLSRFILDVVEQALRGAEDKGVKSPKELWRENVELFPVGR